jgi:hypothetical protein
MSEDVFFFWFCSGGSAETFFSLCVFHHTDTHIYLLSLALALSIHNKQTKQRFCVPNSETDVSK